MEGGRERGGAGGSVGPSMLIASLFFDSENRHVVLFYFLCNVSRSHQHRKQHYILVIATPAAVATGMQPAFLASFFGFPSPSLSLIQGFSRFLTSSAAILRSHSLCPELITLALLGNL